MNAEVFFEYCSGKNAAKASFPFDDKTLVFKVGDKIFSLSNIDDFSSINLKCDPDKSIIYREAYQGIKPGYHMNKKHWNTVMVNADVPDALVKELIDHSYELVFRSLKKRIRDGL